MKQNWTGTAASAAFLIVLLSAAPSFPQTNNDEELLRTRETVWRAWFEGDAQTLEKLVPAETIVMSSGSKPWRRQADVLRASAEFHSQGGKLLRLEFPRT